MSESDFTQAFKQSEQHIKYYVGIAFVVLSIWLLIDRFVLVRAPLAMEGDPDRKEPLLYQTYTPKTLQPFNGKDDEKVLLAVRGKVYDVTKSKRFYGPGGPYSNFAGRDASRGLAKNSFDPEVLTPVDQKLDLLDNLTAEETQSLEDWQSTFDGKYLVVGELVNEE